MVGTTFMISTYYVVEVTWAIYYLGITISSAIDGKKLPWHSANVTGIKDFSSFIKLIEIYKLTTT